MKSLTSIRTLMEPVTVVGPTATLQDVQTPLQMGRPVVLADDGWRFIFPQAVVGYPTTRRLIDVPTHPAPVLSPDTLVDDALDQLYDLKAEWAVVAEENRAVGIVSIRRMLQYVVQEARRSARLMHLLETSLNAGPMLVWHHGDVDTEVPETLEIYGPVEQLLGLPTELVAREPMAWWERIQPEDRTAFEAIRTRLIRTGESQATVLYRYRHPTRGWVWLRDQIHLMRDSEDRPQAWLGVTIDVTDVIRADEDARWAARFQEVLSRRRPGEALEAVLALMAEEVALDAAALLIGSSTADRFRIELQWSREDTRMRTFLDELERLYGGIPRGVGSMADAVLARNAPVYAPDVSQTGFWNARLAMQYGVRTVWTLPVLMHEDNQTLLVLVSRKVNAFPEPFRRRFQGLMPAMAAVVEAWQFEQALRELNTTLEERVRQRTYELQVLYEISQSIGYTLDFEELLRLMLENLHRVVPYDIAASFLYTDKRAEIVLHTLRPCDPALKASIQERLLDAFVHLGGPNVPPERITVRQTRATSEPLAQAPPARTLASLFMVPFYGEEIRRPIGLLLVGSEQPDVFTESHIRLLHTVAAQASVAILRLHRLLAIEQRRLESLIRQLPEGVVLLDAERNVVLANPRGEEYLNLLSPYWTERALDTLGDRTVDELLEPLPPGHSHEVCLTEPHRRVFEILVQPITEGPQTGGHILLMRDVTVEREIEEKVREQDRLAAIGQLAAGIAHDFNNLLTSIMGYAELILYQPEDIERVREFARVIHQQGDRAATMIRQILDFARKTVAEPRPMDLAPFLREQIRLLERTLPETIQIELDIGSDIYWVQADPAQLQQVLTNLAINARDAMPQGGRLTFRLTRWTLAPGEVGPDPEMTPGTYICLAVEDTGIGMPPEVLSRIFEPFFTTKPTGQGTGLGLSQVYGIVKQHNGFIDVRSQFGHGTTVSIYLPAISPDARIDENHATPEQIPRGRGETVLLVEDDPGVLESIRQMLTALGYRVLSAENAEVAVRVFREHLDDIILVLSDVILPAQSGVELSVSLQAEKPDLRIILISGYPLQTDMQHILQKQHVHYLQKPVDLETLARAIARAMQS